MAKNLKILGLDNGFKFTKTSKGVCFCSSIQKGKDDINEVTQVIIDGKNYIVGEQEGKYISDQDKLKDETNKEILKVCTLTAIGLSYPADTFIDINLVVGVPVAYYSKQKEEFKEMIEDLSGEIFINEIGFNQTININKVLVYPQSAGIIFKNATKLKNQSSLVIDIGGGTWDLSQFDGLKLIKKATYQQGMLILDSKITQWINSNYYTTFKTNEVYDLIKKGFFTAYGTKTGVKVFEHIIEDHVFEVSTDIKHDFDVNSVDNIFLIGGGAEILKDYLDKYINNIEIESNPQFTNATCFEVMGQMKWSK